MSLSPKTHKSLDFFKKHPYLLFISSPFVGYVVAAAIHGENALAEVPVVVWTGLISSLVTIIGIGLTNEGNNERLLRQLDHDRFIKKADRTNNIRKQVYLSLVNSINGFERSLLLAPSIPSNERKELEKIFKDNIFQIEIVASQTTRKTAKLLLKEWSDANSQIFNDRVKIRSLHTASEESRERANVAINDYNKLLFNSKKHGSTIKQEEISHAEKVMTKMGEDFDINELIFTNEEKKFIQKVDETFLVTRNTTSLLIENIREELEIPAE